MAKKRNNGEGSITYDKSRKSYRVAVTTPNGDRLYKRFKDEGDAIAWKTDQLHSMQKGTFVAPNNMTVGEWTIKWLTTYKKDTVKQRTYERYTSLANHFKTISTIKLQELKPLQVQELYQQLALSACTIIKVHNLLKDMYNKAFELELIQKNIMTVVKPPKYEPKEIEIFTPEEIQQILKVCSSHGKLKKYYPAVLLGVVTGARLGEILGLRWMDIKLATSEIHIRKSLQKSHTLGLFLETPKTKASISKIAIPFEAVEALKKLKAKTKNLDLKQEKLAFVTRNDTPVAPRNFERAWEDILRNANIAYKKFHTLRHTHATELLSKGIPLSDVAKRLGHSKQSHTLELYSHAMPQNDELIMGTIQKLYLVPK